MADAPESVFPDVADISGRPVELTDHQRYILRTVGPTWQWSAAAFVAAVAFAALGWFAAESDRDRLAEKVQKLEVRLGAAEQATAALERPACMVWVRSTTEQPMAVRRCEEWESSGIPGAKVVVDRATYIADEYGRVPIFRRDALVRVSARGYETREFQVTNCGESFVALLRPANYLWPDPVVEVPLSWAR